MFEISRGQLRAPARILDVDIADVSESSDIDVDGYVSAWCLVRANGVVVDARFFDIETDSYIRPTSLRECLRGSVHPMIADATQCSPLSMTVVICTNRGENLPKVLNSLSAQSDPTFDVLIVDNSADGHIAGALPNVAGLTVRSCHEPRPGLSRARNAALDRLSSDLVAWIDDDEEADRDWIAWIRRGFGLPSAPDVVVGVMLPAELDTQAQVEFERYGGFTKGRPMYPVELRAGTDSVVDPFYPLPSFGSGGNMAFRTEVLRAIGGFDTRLGSPAIRGGEETRALSELLERGSMILHWPPAMTWHYHRRTDAELERQFFGYSAGLAAFYASVMMASPKHALRLARLLPRGVMQVRGGRRAAGPDGPPVSFPDHLLRAGRRGLYFGAWLYVWEAYRQRRAEVVR